MMKLPQGGGHEGERPIIAPANSGVLFCRQRAAVASIGRGLVAVNGVDLRGMMRSILSIMSASRRSTNQPLYLFGIQPLLHAVAEAPCAAAFGLVGPEKPSASVLIIHQLRVTVSTHGDVERKALAILKRLRRQGARPLTHDAGELLLQAVHELLAFQKREADLLAKPSLAVIIGEALIRMRVEQHVRELGLLHKALPFHGTEGVVDHDRAVLRQLRPEDLVAFAIIGFQNVERHIPSAAR